MRLSNQVIIHRRHHANLLHDARIRIPACPPPSSPSRTILASAAEIENTPWLADWIDPTWLPESAANLSAECPRIPRRLCNHVRLQRIQAVELVPDPTLPLAAHHDNPGLHKSAVFSPAFAILSTSPDCTVTVCSTMYRDPVIVPAIFIRQFVRHLICPTEISFGVTPLRRKKLQHRLLSVFALRKHLRQIVPRLLERSPARSRMSDFTVLSTRSLHRHIPVRQLDVS